MTPFAIYLDDVNLECEATRIQRAFTRRILEIAGLTRSESHERDSGNPLNMLSLPALLLDLDGDVVEVNDAAKAIFDNDIRVRQRRLYVRDLEARNKLRLYVDDFGQGPAQFSPTTEPLVVPRQGKLPALLRTWSIEAPARWPTADVRALMTLSPLGPRPGPSPALLAKTFSLTPSEAKLASIIARGAGPDTASTELKISRETARNQLKSIFAKTSTHRQGELVALLLQV